MSYTNDNNVQTINDYALDDINKVLENDEVIASQLTEKECKWVNSKFKLFKNLFVIGFSWMFLFTAYQSMANLQSSINSDAGLGTASLSTIYVTLVFSCLFIPPIMIKNIGIKWTIVLSQSCYVLFIAANMYPKWYLLIPAAIILGMGAAPVWTAKCTYLTEIAGFYSKIAKEKHEVVVNRFFGIFFAMFQTTQIWGNVISSTVLQQEVINGTNLTLDVSKCGINDCPSNEANSNTKKPLMSTIYILCGIYVGLAIIGILFILFFLDSYPRDDQTKIKGKVDEKNKKKSFKHQFDLVKSTIVHLKKRNQLLIIPITLWLGFEQAFIGADFTKSFVTCTKGVKFVGLTMICFGVTDVIGSYLFGLLAKYIGRIACFTIPCILNYAVILLMIFWKPNVDQIFILFLIPIIWGLADAAWQTQINSIYGILFPDTQEAAFSNFRLWESLAFAVAYGYSSSLCVSIKLYLLLAYLTVGIVCYALIEILDRRKKFHKVFRTNNEIVPREIDNNEIKKENIKF